MLRIPSICLALFFTQLAVASEAKISEGKIIVAGLTSVKGLTVVVAEGSEADIAGRPAMAGEWSVEKSGVVFTPRFALRAGTKYRVLGIAKGLDVSVPKVAPGKPTHVTMIYPLATELPENILRFYVHFNKPMPRGDAYTYVDVFTADRKRVDQPFLQLDNELWNADQTRLTLLIDPGRIKKEVKPRLDLGPVFMEGGKYTLVISGKWPTLDGQTLGNDVTKAIHVGPAINKAIDPKAWKLSRPTGETGTLRLSFGRPMDQPLLMRCLAVVGPDGRKIAGKSEVLEKGLGWEFHTAEAWKPGQYKLHVDQEIEDVCGNRVGQPFEIDLLNPAKKRPAVRDADLPFTVADR